MIGALGMPLLDWLERSALPEESRLADTGYASAVAAEFLGGLTAAGTTTALVFGAHFADAVDVLFRQAAEVGLRITSGLVVSDRVLRPDLLTTPQAAYDEGLALARTVARRREQPLRRHPALLAVLHRRDARLVRGPEATRSREPGSPPTSTRTSPRSRRCGELFDGCDDYLSTYDRHGLVGPAQRVRPQRAPHRWPSSASWPSSRRRVAHCPTSNAALGSGLFPLREHVGHGVRVALGSDVGAGTGFSLFKEGLQAYFMQQLLGERGLALTPAHLLHLATSAGAAALGLADEVGDLSVGKQFDAVWLRPETGGALDIGLRHADGRVRGAGQGVRPGRTRRHRAGVRGRRGARGPKCPEPPRSPRRLPTYGTNVSRTHQESDDRGSHGAGRQPELRRSAVPRPRLRDPRDDGRRGGHHRPLAAGREGRSPARDHPPAGAHPRRPRLRAPGGVPPVLPRARG